MKDVMQKIVLNPTDGKAVEFTGEPLLQFHGNDNGETGGRWHDINVYRSESGDLYVEIVYHTSAAGESANCQVEEVTNATEVDATLSLYEPQQFLKMESGPARKRLVNVLLQRYDTQVNDVLSAFQDSEPDSPASKPR